MADTQKDYLPPAGGSELATRDDLHHTAQALCLEMRAIGTRLATTFDDKINRQTRLYMASQLVLIAAIVGSITSIPH